jgi:wyosine [tRNA(Phe)-imidazoG37] synthetase (radical SAM superfamily)
LIELVLQAVEKALRKPRSMDVLTFAGNGEPTLHPFFLEIVQGVKIVRDHLRPDLKLALLSNSSRVMVSNVQKAIDIIEMPMMKLDAGDQRTFGAINRPLEGLNLSEIIKGLRSIRGLIIQSMLIDGPNSNISGEAFQSWSNTILDIDPKEVHIYSTERPTAEESVIKVDPRKLKQIENELIKHYGLNVHAF